MTTRIPVLAFAMAVASLHLHGGESPSRRLTVMVTDSYGRRLDTARISVQGSGATYDVKEGVAIDLKPGVYELTAIVPGFRTYTGIATIDQPSQVLSIAMRLGGWDGPAPRCSVRGYIEPHTNGVRIRLMPLVGTEMRDVFAGGNGTFEFEDLECGTYMFLALRGVECLGATTAKVTTERMRLRLQLAQPVGRSCVPVAPPGER
jgi:hypothetical protein